jgi:hypothetical protein
MQRGQSASAASAPAPAVSIRCSISRRRCRHSRCSSRYTSRSRGNDRHIRACAISGHLSRDNERTCTPLHPKDGRFDPNSPIDMPLSARLDEISLPPAAQSEQFLAHFALLVAPEAFSRPLKSQKAGGLGRPPPPPPPAPRGVPPAPLRGA